MKEKAGLLLHPARMLILQAFSGGKALSPAELSMRLPGLPQASLYRHLAVLKKSGLIKVDEDSSTSSRREKRLCLATGAESINPADFNALSHDERLALFMAFQSLVLAQFEAWSAGPEPDALRDGLSFRQATLWLSDGEFERFAGEYKALLHRYLGFSPETGRKMRSISTIFISGGMESTGGNYHDKP